MGANTANPKISLLGIKGSNLAWRNYGRFLTHPDQARNPNELEDIDRLPGNARTQASDIWSLAVAEFTSREMHVIKRALAIAALAVERVTERSHSDDANLKALLIKLVESDVELVMYVREARIALTGEPGGRRHYRPRWRV